MKYIFISLILAYLPMTAICQVPAGKSERLRILLFDEADAVFGKQAVKAGMEYECCVEAQCKCTDLKDPWEEDKNLPVPEQVSRMAGNSKAAPVQQAMAQWEKSILAGDGKGKISAENVKQAFSKYPGYSLRAINQRLDTYIRLMEERAAGR